MNKREKDKVKLRKLKMIEEYKESVKNRSPEEKQALRVMEEASLEDVFTMLDKKEKNKSKLRKEMAEGYKRNMNNKKLQKELELWDRISGDGID